MENASKALIIAGEVLIGIMVISLMVSVISKFGKFSADMHETMTQAQIGEFNSNFYAYENRTNITATEIVTIINFAKQTNDSRELSRNETSSDYYTTVFIDDKDVFNNANYINNDEDYDKKLGDFLNGFIKENNTSYFSCIASLTKVGSSLKVQYPIDYENDIEINENTHLVNRIKFHKIPESVTSIPDSF